MSDLFRDKVILAPMMRGSNRTFRRLAHRWGADILGGEMAYAYKVKKEDRKELVLISARNEEGFFWAQICGRIVNVLTEAAIKISDRGAGALDLNAGCPMHFVTCRGEGSALLEQRSLKQLAKIVEALKKAVDLPITVKIRAGFSSKKKVPLAKIAQTIEQAGADALTVHARFRDQYYETPADWSHIKECVEAVDIPVIGNGDIRTYQDALKMKDQTGCASVMIGRAALQRPWIFQEIKEKKTLNPSAGERWEMIRDHFEMIHDTFGEKRGFQVFRWHAGWYIRWRPDHREIRCSWDDLSPEHTSKVVDELKSFIIEGPEILPPPSLKHEEVEAG